MNILKKADKIINDVSINRFFLFFSIFIFLFSTVIFYIIVYRDISQKAIHDIEKKSAQIEKSFISSMKYSSYLMNYLGKQIERNDNVDFVDKLLSSFWVTPEKNSEISWNMFSWINKNNYLVANSHRKNIGPIDMSYRDYIYYSMVNPWHIQFGKATIGAVSKQNILPVSMGVTKKGKYIGTLIFGFNLHILLEQIYGYDKENQVIFDLYNIKGDKILSSSPTNVFGDEIVQKCIMNYKKIDLIDEINLYGQGNYIYCNKIPGYPFLIITKYKDNYYFNQILQRVFYIALIYFGILIFLLVIFYTLKSYIIKPISSLSKISDKILKTNKYPLNVTKFKIKEINDLREKILLIRDYKHNVTLAKESQERFFVNMSHELRTPLNGIINFTIMIKEEMYGPVQQEYKELLEDIYISSIHLLDLVNNILDFSKMNMSKEKIYEEKFELKPVIEESIRVVNITNSEFEFTFDKNIKYINADLKMLKRILLNILSNAVKYGEGNKIKVKSYIDDEEQLIIEVEDYGIGIKKEDLEKLAIEFGRVGEANSRYRYQGTGLGLYLTKKMIELHQGKFIIDSVYKVKTNVKVILPKNRLYVI